MAKASLILPDGTKVDIDGSPEEIRKILGTHTPTQEQIKPEKRREQNEVPTKANNNLSEIVNSIKSCKEADLIGQNRISVVDRVLLPLYIIHTYLSPSQGLTSGEISKILSELGIGIHVPNISNTLSSTASKYVLGDKMRKKGQPVRYRISRKGMDYLKTVITGNNNG